MPAGHQLRNLLVELNDASCQLPAAGAPFVNVTFPRTYSEPVTRRSLADSVESQ